MQLEAAHAVEITKLVEYVDRKEDPLIQFDVFPTVHHSIGYFLEPTLMHTSI